MTVIATIDDIAVHTGRPAITDPVVATSEGFVADRPCTVTLTTRGLYLSVDGGPSFAVDINALARALGETVEDHLLAEAQR